MYHGVLNSACCLIMLAVTLLILDQSLGFTNSNYVQVGDFIRFIKSLG